MRAGLARHTAWAALVALPLSVFATGQPSAQPDEPTAMDSVAEQYVRLVLALGQHDADYVDAYFGPAEWPRAAERERPLADIGAEAERLIDQLGEPTAAAGSDDLVVLRHRSLRRQLDALLARVRMLSGTTLTFDEESRALYDAVAPAQPESQFQRTLAALDRRLQGQGALIERYDAFRQDFVVAAERLDRVFDRAIAECRARTLDHVDLPATESFTVEYVTDKSWSAYNWYQGNYRSVIQVNTDLPIHIDRAVDLACHEGYPGHHVYNVLGEQHLLRDRGWIEFAVYPLFSPRSLIAEGTANYGIEVAFPKPERLAFEREVLFPAAGLDASRVAEYYEVHALIEQLGYAGNEAARHYLNGDIDRETAAAWLTRYAMMSPARAAQRTRFFDQYRSYVINYNLGKDLVRQFVESRSGDRPASRWNEFARLLASPRSPSDLQ